MGLPAALAENGFVPTHAGIDESGAGPTGVLLARGDRHRVRPYEPGDEQAILELFARSFGVVRTPRRWAWEYLDNPLGNARISLAFSPERQLVAQYAGYPVRLACAIPGAPAVLHAHHVGDTMTAPTVRNIGRGPSSVLGRTVRHFYSRFCEAQVAFNYGVNTGNIQKFSTRFVGAQLLEPIPYHSADAATVRAARAGRGLLSGLSFAPIDHFGAEHDALFERVKPAYELLVERSSRYLNWRYLQCPDNVYRAFAVRRWGRLCGWCVVRVDHTKSTELRWGDALFDPAVRHAAPALLRWVLERSQFRDIERIVAWLPPRPAWWGQVTADFGFEPAAEPQSLGFMIVPFREGVVGLAAEHLHYCDG